MPAGIGRLEPLNDWDTTGMRATGSHNHRLREMFVSDDQVWFIREPGAWDTYLMKMFFWVWMGMPAVYLGLAKAMRNFAVQWAGKRVLYPAPRPVAHEPRVKSAVARKTPTWPRRARSSVASA